MPKLQYYRHRPERFYLTTITPAFAAAAITAHRQHSDDKKTQKVWISRQGRTRSAIGHRALFRRHSFCWFTRRLHFGVNPVRYRVFDVIIMDMRGVRQQALR
jgi:hypothetical protein